MTTFPTAGAARLYTLAGKAVIVLRSKKTSNHLTFRVERNRHNALRWWVSTKGVDGHFRYLGMLEDHADHFALHLTGKSAAYRPSIIVNAFDYFVKHVLSANTIPDDLEVRHEGHCGRCGRALTDPRSIDMGIGPECMKSMGVAYPKEE